MIVKMLQASDGDCILLSFKDNEKIQRNILIDSGREETYFDFTNNQDGALKVEVDRIKKTKEKIDLLIITHIDDDHICGLKRWFEMDKDSSDLIDKVWFNSGKLIAEYFKSSENQELALELNLRSSSLTSINKAIPLEEFLLKKGIWEHRIIKDGVDIVFYGMRIQILSPNDSQLLKLLKEYRKQTNDPAYTGGSSNDWNISLKELINDENLNYQTPIDGSPSNASSISFILSVHEKNFLFLADAPSKQIVSSLNAKNYNKDNPLFVEFVKVPHHGSEKNLSNELLEVVKSDKFLISTDSSQHGHPNKRTLARILRFNPKAMFYFNYRHVKETVISSQDYNDLKDFKAYFSLQLSYENEQ